MQSRIVILYSHMKLVKIIGVIVIALIIAFSASRCYHPDKDVVVDGRRVRLVYMKDPVYVTNLSALLARGYSPIDEDTFTKMVAQEESRLKWMVYSTAPLQESCADCFMPDRRWQRKLVVSSSGPSRKHAIGHGHYRGTRKITIPPGYYAVIAPDDK